MRLLSALCLLAASTALLAAEDKKPADAKTSAKAQVIGLALRKAPQVKAGPSMFMPNGVTMDLVISQPGKFIVGVDAKASKLESFTDDKNNDLKKPAGFLAGPSNWINEYAIQYAPDGEQCTIQVSAGKVPGKGAGKILVKALLSLKCGVGEKSLDKKELALKKDEEVSAGDFKMKVNFVGGFGANLSVLSAEPRVKTVEFFDAAGKAIKPMSSSRGINLFGAPGGKPQAVVGYFLSGKMDKVSFKITYFDKIESITVPLDVRVGLDLE